MYNQFFSGPVSETQTTQSYKPGEIVTTTDTTYGTRVWRYIKNTEAATAYAVGNLVRRKAATVDNMSSVGAATNKLARFLALGVAQNVIAFGSYGFVLKEGIGYGLGDGSVAAGDSVMGDGTFGRMATATLTDAASVAAVVGVALEDDSGSPVLFRAHFALP